jgi:hypothetical protein
VSSCPSPERLQDWLADRLAGPDAEAIGAHIEACARCRQTLEQLTGRTKRCQEVTVDAAGADFLRRLEKEPPAAAQPLTVTIASPMDGLGQVRVARSSAIEAEAVRVLLRQRLRLAFLVLTGVCGFMGCLAILLRMVLGPDLVPLGRW